MELRHPARDEPRWASVGLVGALCFALGLTIAYWGTGESVDGQGPADAETVDEAEPADGEGALAARDPAPARADAAPQGGADAGGVVSDENPADAGAAVGPPPAADANAAGASPPGPAPTRFVRGRVAYLRCDGAARRGRCPRDVSLEDAVWAVLARLADCGLPAAGEGDLRIAWERETPADVLWRDTFADDVVRLDRDAVMRCVEAPLTETRPSTPTERLFVSFRFRLE